MGGSSIIKITPTNNPAPADLRGTKYPLQFGTKIGDITSYPVLNGTIKSVIKAAPEKAITEHPGSTATKVITQINKYTSNSCA